VSGVRDNEIIIISSLIRPSVHPSSTHTHTHTHTHVNWEGVYTSSILFQLFPFLEGFYILANVFYFKIFLIIFFFFAIFFFHSHLWVAIVSMGFLLALPKK
jgi:hypothetical protein